MSFDSWAAKLADSISAKAKPKYSKIVHACEDHRGADFCTACGEEVDEDGNTESRPVYCSRHCGCVGTGCPMGLMRGD